MRFFDKENPDATCRSMVIASLKGMTYGIVLFGVQAFAMSLVRTYWYVALPGLALTGAAMAAHMEWKNTY
jgi:hypothetical protein